MPEPAQGLYQQPHEVATPEGVARVRVKHEPVRVRWPATAMPIIVCCAVRPVAAGARAVPATAVVLRRFHGLFDAGTACARSRACAAVAAPCPATARGHDAL